MSFAPVRPLRPAWQIAALALICSLAVAASGVAFLGHDALESFNWNTWLLVGVGFTMAVGGAAWAAAQWMSPSGRASFWQPALGVLFVGMGLWLGAEAGPFQLWPIVICFSFGSAAALAAGLVLIAVFRRTSPLMRHRVAVATGIVAGFAGFLVIQMHCPISEISHMMLGHALLPIVWGLAGYLLARFSWAR